MRTDYTDLPEWLTRNLTISGAEGESEGDAAKAAADAAAAQVAADAAKAEEEAAAKDKGEEDVAGLKSALAKERENNKNLKQAEKDLKAAQARLKEIDDKDKSDGEKATEAATKAAEKVTKLATRLRDQALDTIIEREARKAGFKDTDDALKLVDRSSIGVEQDEDDPSDVQIDDKSVKAAVEKLAKAKEHLLGGEGDGAPSGSKFGGGKKNTKEASDAELTKKYPALR